MGVEIGVRVGVVEAVGVCVGVVEVVGDGVDVLVGVLVAVFVGVICIPARNSYSRAGSSGGAA